MHKPARYKINHSGFKEFVEFRVKNCYEDPTDDVNGHGDRFLERIKSLFATSILQDLNPWQELHSQLT